MVRPCLNVQYLVFDGCTISTFYSKTLVAVRHMICSVSGMSLIYFDVIWLYVMYDC